MRGKVPGVIVFARMVHIAAESALAVPVCELETFLEPLGVRPMPPGRVLVKQILPK